MGRFEDKVVLITDAGSGMGRASAHRLVGEGATVVVNDITQERAEATAAELDGRGSPIGADVANGAAVESMYAETMDRFGRIDGVANVAGSPSVTGGTATASTPRSRRWNGGMHG